MSVELHLTKDHSHTLYVPELDETYHSRNGAVEEALYVYIGRGLLDTVQGAFGSPTVAILEMGFGTGLNAWLTAIACHNLPIKCRYTTLETFPLPVTLIEQLNYTHGAPETHQQLFRELHAAEWNQPASLTPAFTLRKQHTSLQDFVPTETYDIIYFDAFAPEKQPELWTQELFQRLYNCLNPNGVIVTYSSKGAIKRMWKNIGFTVERLPGPPLKRHMLRGTKTLPVPQQQPVTPINNP